MGAKLPRVLGSSVKAPWGCPGSLPKAERGRSSKGTVQFHISLAYWNREPHDHLALREDITPPLEPRLRGPSVDTAPPSKEFL